MFKQLINKSSPLSPHVVIVGALITVVLVAGAALLFTRGGSEAKAESTTPRAARLDRVDGSVAIARVENESKQAKWTEATVNTPVTVGDRIYARDGAHTSVALTGHNFVRLNPETAVDVLTLEERRTQLALRSGSALFDVGSLTHDDFYEVATPCGAVDFTEPGLYQVGLDEGNAIISVLSGVAQVVGDAGSGSINKGQVFTLFCGGANQALSSTIAPSLAGDIVDDYYRYRYPRVYDGRYRSYDAYLSDPYYYDPYRTSVSCQYVPADVAGLYDLDYYGDWVDLADYGYSWSPRVSAGWAPFRSGFWDVDDLWGPSWVSYEPWGWAPYHYGRWAFVNQRWFWVPVEVRAYPAYVPATVAFIPFGDQIAWLPLGPREVYVARYYDDDFRPTFLAPASVINEVTVQQTFVNFNAPGAVTVVPVQSFTRVIDPRVISTVDLGLVARSRQVIDPFSVAGVRELALRGDDARRSARLERRELEAFNRPVVAVATPGVTTLRSDVAKSLAVEAVPEARKRDKLKVEQTPQAAVVRRPDGLPQPLVSSQRMAELASRAEQGDKSARREMRQLMREQQAAPQAAQPTPPPADAQQQAQQEQTRQQMREQRKLERQQQAAGAAQQAEQQRAARLQQREQMRQQQQQQAQQRMQTRQQRKAERQQQSAAAAQQQGAARRAQREQMRQQQQQQEVTRQQRKQQKQERRKPPEAFVQQRQAEQVRQRQVEQTRQRQAQAQMAQREQFKAQKRAEQQQRQAVMQQQAARAQAAQAQAIQQREQFKAQKRAQQQQQMIRQQQVVRPPAGQPQAGPQKAPVFIGPPVRENAPSRAERKAEKAQRKPPQ